MYVLMSLKKGESIKIKMSTNRVYVNDSEEEEMVRRVGGRGRGLVQAVLRIRRERAGRTPQNLEQESQQDQCCRRLIYVVKKGIGDWEDCKQGKDKIRPSTQRQLTLLTGKGPDQRLEQG